MKIVRAAVLSVVFFFVCSAVGAEQYLNRREAMRAAGDFKAQKRYIDAERAYNEAARLSKTNNDRKSAWDSAREMRGRARALQNEFENRIRELEHQKRIRDDEEIVDRCYYELFRDDSFPVSLKFQAYRRYSGMLSRDGDTARLKGDYKRWREISQKRARLASEAATLPDLPLKLRDEALSTKMNCANLSGNHQMTVEAASYLLENGSSRALRESAAALLVYGYIGLKDYPNAIRAGEIFLRESTGSIKQKNGIRVQIGNACLQLKRYQDAVRTFRPVAYAKEEAGSNNWEIRSAKRGLITAYIGLKDDVQIKRACEEFLQDNYDESLNNFLRSELFKAALRSKDEAKIHTAYERLLKEAHTADSRVSGILLYASYQRDRNKPDKTLALLREAWNTSGCSASQKENILRMAASLHSQMKNEAKYRRCMQKLAETIQRADPFEQMLQRAYAASAAGNHAQALGLGEKAVEITSDQAKRRTALLFCAQKQMDRREYQAALNDFSRIGSIGDLPAERQIDIAKKQALCYFRLGNPERAERIFRKILSAAKTEPAAYPHLPGIFNDLRTILAKEKKGGEIIELVKPFSSESYPERIRGAALLQMVQSYRSDLRDIEKARDAAEQLLALEELPVMDQFRGRLELTHCLLGEKKYAEAEESIRKALELPGLSPAVRFWGWGTFLEVCRAAGKDPEGLYREILADPGVSVSRKTDIRLKYAEQLIGKQKFGDAKKQLSLCRQGTSLSSAQQTKLRTLEQKLKEK